MMLSAVLVVLAAVVAADQTLNVNGRKLLVFTGKKSYNAAKSTCEGRGALLLTICSEQELNAVRAAGITGKVTTEYWIGLPSSKNHHAIFRVNELASISSGNRCRILSNWASKPWSVYTKDCTTSRPYICETGDISATCPASRSAGGKDLFIYTKKVGYNAAKSQCERQGNSLLGICNEEELNAVRAAGITGPVTTEYWIGLPSSKNHHAIIPVDQLASINSGDNCRILSNWASKPWSVYTKFCSSTRPFICQAGPLSPCPVPTDPPTPAPVDPTEAPTDAPVTCPEQRERFKANGLPVEPSFAGDSCRFQAKQCNAEKCFCVSPRKGVRKQGKLEVPLGHDYDCNKKAKKCFQRLFKILIQEQLNGATPNYKPQCTTGGTYEPKQCDNNGECWCAKKRGRERRGTRDSNGADVQCE